MLVGPQLLPVPEVLSLGLGEVDFVIPGVASKWYFWLCVCVCSSGGVDW